MTLGSVAWPPEPIRTERLVLRATEARDRPAFIELYASPEVHKYLGGAQPRADLERDTPAVPAEWPGSFVADLEGDLIGHLMLRRPERHRPAAVGKVDLGYLFLPRAWGQGYATEACGAVLTWFDGALPGEPVVLATQTANTGSMRLAARLGFTERERFHAWDADQWLGERVPSPTQPRSASTAVHSAGWPASRIPSSISTTARSRDGR
ncbi:GNAT family N-acetyltransferase [Actinoplanes bogorensis]|uniref:GNAT family N-acetyltransferase n=1 Tax=Paractinoplanes bogorensis TaxID=1610840 RepID=A0ABS5Z087_9ACTN|nr:GNAT family N-acetyltransferase [Actinoplanes bogorensis]MBU2669104.1 GNAT family N-acetyltransferase [Actinoplanes bogorensis]